MTKQYDLAITVGVFDLTHEGHVALFEFMRTLADETVAIVHDDFSTYRNKKRFPIQPVEVRERNVKNFVDLTYTVSTADPTLKLDTILFRRQSEKIVYVRGDDWLNFPGRPLVEKYGIPIVLKPYTKGVSSTQRRSEL